MSKIQLWNSEPQWIDPESVEDSRLNIAPPLATEKLNILIADIEKNGQKESGIVWKGKVFAGRHRRKAAIKLGRKFKAIVLPDSLTQEEVIEIADRDAFISREWTAEEEVDFIWKRFHPMIQQMKQGGSPDQKVKPPGGGTPINVAVYIAQKIGRPLRTVERRIAAARAIFIPKESKRSRLNIEDLEDSATTRLRYRNLRAGRKILEKYEKAVQGQREKLDSLEKELLETLPRGFKGSRQEKLDALDKLLGK